MGDFDKNFRKFSVSESVLGTTNEMLLAFPPDLVEKLKPIPIEKVVFVDVLDFNSQTREDIVKEDLYAKDFDDLFHRDWCSIAWTRTLLRRIQNQNRRFQRYSKAQSDENEAQVFWGALSEVLIQAQVFSSSVEWLEALQEILAICPLETGFNFTFDNQSYHASYLDFSQEEIQFLERKTYGNLCSFSMSFSIRYPLVLKVYGGKFIKQVNTKYILSKG